MTADSIQGAYDLATKLRDATGGNILDIAIHGVPMAALPAGYQWELTIVDPETPDAFIVAKARFGGATVTAYIKERTSNGS